MSIFEHIDFAHTCATHFCDAQLEFLVFSNDFAFACALTLFLPLHPWGAHCVSGVAQAFEKMLQGLGIRALEILS